ncbi:AraC family transcriptional regulator [Paenibacillus sp. FA6]|uniref:AraC family transcriptional regulator n=1 Tax=Paenibacillus sp. FA6 TaxID=3413029 RepID=UPI003F659042
MFFLPNTYIHNETVYVSLDNLLINVRSIELLHDGWLEQQLVESHVLIIVKSGMGRLMMGINEYILKQDAVHIAVPGQTIGVSRAEADELDLYVIKFDVFRDRMSVEIFPMKGELLIYPQTEMVILCELMNSCYRSEQSLERFRGQSVFQELLYLIIKNIRQLPDLDSRGAMDRTKAYIESHYHESLTIQLLARMAEISPKYYVNLFKKIYYKSTIDYVTEVRINNAKKLMVHSDVRLRDIAHQVGYNDEFYFSRIFKKVVGVSPKAYMKNRRRKIVAYSSGVLGQLLALDIIPYGAPLHPKWSGYYYKMYRADIQLHLSAYRYDEDWESNIEAITHAEPDMIISIDILQPVEKERLESVAPVIYIPWIDKNWREQLQLTAEYLGVSQEAEAWILNYDKKVKFARERLNRELRDDTILIMSIYKQTYFLCPARGMKEVLYDDLQLKLVPQVHPFECKQPLTIDQLVELDADRILLNICQEPESLDHWRSLQTSSLWQNLKAVRRNHVYYISSDPWREYSAYACERIVDDMLRIMDGDRP